MECLKLSEETLDTKVAVLTVQMDGLREQQKAHAAAQVDANTATSKKFDTVFEKLDQLFAVMNRGKGAFTASMVLAGGIGAFMMKALSWFMGR